VPRAELDRLYPAIVADFRREYRLDLLGADARLGAETFLLLLSGLSSRSVLWSQVASERRAEEQRPLEGEAAEAALVEFFGGRR